LRLGALGIEPGSLDGILLSHEHGDHVRGLDVFLRKHRVPIFATALTREVVEDKVKGRVEWRVFQRGQEFELGELSVRAFAIPHDAVDPVGFVCRNHDVKVGVATDLGHVTGVVREELKGVRGLFVESNYDQGMLDADTKRPWATKQRIASRHGHLSNGQAAELVAELAEHGLQDVFLGHLSADCNSPITAAEAVTGMSGKVRVRIAPQEEPTDWFSWQVTQPIKIGSGGQGMLF
jgi:phosphoribosyl 1,2-cyclic phosphodiesterase